MFEKFENERMLRWMLKKISPAAYSKHHVDVLLENLYGTTFGGNRDNEQSDAARNQTASAIRNIG